MQVSYKWLSRNFSVSSNAAKRYCFSACPVNINVCTGILSGYEGCMHAKILVVSASVSVFNFEK